VSRVTPHPAASRPPSPARGEGSAPSIDDALGDERLASAASGSINSVREPRIVGRTEMKRAKPSPLAGEGGTAQSAVPGEGTAPRNKRRVRKVPEPVAFARKLRRNQTNAEQVLWTLLRNDPFRPAKFRRQVPLGPYVADFASFSTRILIEVDGPIHEPSKDKIRDAWLVAHGWRVLRFSNRQLLTDLRLVAANIASAIDSASIESHGRTP
jgi:very-short-patch-repair endonuclease